MIFVSIVPDIDIKKTALRKINANVSFWHKTLTEKKIFGVTDDKNLTQICIAYVFY